MKFSKQTIIILFLLTSPLFSCKKYLDVVPDNIATIEYAFRMKTTAKKFLYTCYSYIPNQAEVSQGFLFSGDELWYPIVNTSTSWAIGMGLQNVNGPYLDYWNGLVNSKPMWRGIRECNIFLENIESVPDLDPVEKAQWAAEAKFLKAYYHFFMMTLYGPIPVVRENLSIATGVDDVKVTRRPIDEVVDYVVQLLDEASQDLPNAVQDPLAENGRITAPIAKALKAKVLVYAASPLFNGNSEYSGYTNKDGTKLFNQTYSAEKWKRAAEAAKEAVDLCESLGYTLYKFQSTTPETAALSQDTKNQMNVRNVITERWNSEVIWADPNSYTANLQNQATPRYDISVFGNSAIRGNFGVPFKIVSLFYTKNGLPIDEDKTWSYASRYNLRVGTALEKYSIKEGYTTAEFNFGREPRFYADFGFDGGIWYGQGKYDDNATYVLQCKIGQPAGKTNTTGYSPSGYYAKKYIHYTNVASTTTGTNTLTDYPWVLMRLADLYLLYAEAVNEAEGPDNGEALKYLNLIRERASIPTVQDAWTNFSINKQDKFRSREGLRDIIHRERYIEMALEGQRFWDVRRWKEAQVELTRPISGWDMDQEATATYYRERTTFRPTFTFKDYFWPIRAYDLIINKNLVQSPGW